ncbi:GlxA family transcriptional regulator [Pseudomonas sp. JBR1]|uniref:GlxA family transcriptional regulator n=1 Tax=Pseudomonas sp. JBR1 TaxID=3020907 RepID=UPI002305881A|nr:GlxA family transcriptional regulator [Pseudomonas sp. JBR1]WCE08660.1 GlxA family transcriptional regulator [Pseudomonas sp. JBR1]
MAWNDGKLAVSFACQGLSARHMQTQKSASAQCVDIVIYPGFKALEAVGAVSVFEYANTRLLEAGLPAAYALRLCAPVPGMILSDTQIVLEARHGLTLEADLALIVGARDIDRALADQPGLIEWSRRMARRPATLVGLCSGAFFLAEAGVLDGQRATTHWRLSSQLARRYPRIEVVEDAIFLQAGHVWTSAGVTAALDLSLALVERDLGLDVALAVARDLVVYLKRPGGQAQFSQYLHSQMTRHTGVRQLQEWILRNLDQPLGISELSTRAAMSPRNLGRVFRRETGCSPAVFVERGRIELARRLLEDGKAPLKQVARRCGFGSDDHLRRVFRRHLGVTPKAYQDRFGRGAKAMQESIVHALDADRPTGGKSDDRFYF